MRHLFRFPLVEAEKLVFEEICTRLPYLEVGIGRRLKVGKVILDRRVVHFFLKDVNFVQEKDHGRFCKPSRVAN
jgi:uncharacterized UPF0146 family protein